MSMSTGVHLHADTIITPEADPPIGDRGYLRIEFGTNGSVFPYVTLHGNAADMRRLATVARHLADQLDPPAADIVLANFYPEEQSA